MKRILALLILLLFASPAWGATYFLSATAASNGDGSSYENAGNTLKSSGWNFSPGDGDTVYVCDTWPGGVSNKSHLELENLPGVIVRGDYPDHPGVIIGMVYRFTDGWADEGDGTFSRSFPASSYAESECGFALEDDATTDIPDVDDQATCISTAGSLFYDTETETLYYHPSDETGANDHVFSFFAANSIIKDGSTGITVRNLTFRGASLVCGHAVNNVSVLYNDFKWGSYYGAIYVGGSTGNHVSGWNISYNTIQYYCAGVYFTTGNGGTETPYDTHSNMYVAHNDVRNTAHAAYTTMDQDDHAFACQGCVGCTWEYNYAEDVCNGFAAYMYPNVDFYNNKVRYNHFKDGHDAGLVTQIATAILESVNSLSTEHNNTNNIYSFNIIENFTRGARPTSYDTAYFYNNVFHGCTQGIRTFRNAASEMNTDFMAKNNIFSGCTYAFYNASGATAGYSCVFQYNLYTSGTLFYTGYGDDSGDFDWWTAQSAWGTGTLVPDTTGSLVGDPSFLNAGGSYDLDTDFQIDSDSDAIDAGTDVGLTEDYWGTSLPQGGQYDIGVYEYYSGETPPDVNIQTGVSFSGVNPP